MSYLTIDKNVNNSRLSQEIAPKQKDLHHSWAGQLNKDGSFRVADSHGKQAYHPYTKIGFEFGVTF